MGFSCLCFIACLLCSLHPPQKIPFPFCPTSVVTLSTPFLSKLPSQPQLSPAKPIIPKQDLLWLPLNYTPFYSAVYQSKTSGKGGGGASRAPGAPVSSPSLSPAPTKESWQGMSSSNAVAVPAAQSHPIPNCPQRWQIMEKLWSENGL